MKRLLALAAVVVSYLGFSWFQSTPPLDQLPDLISTHLVSEEPPPNADGLAAIPDFDGSRVITINNNQPTFSADDLTLSNGYWQQFTDLDQLNRVGAANAMLHKSFMPAEDRGDISNVYPSGWNQKSMGPNKWLYDRSHLIGHQLTGEDANWLNLFTGTSQMNQYDMVDYENQVADYLRKTGHHVRYRVTPLFISDELVCRGVQIEAQSVEDQQLMFNVFIYNVYEGVTINYATGAAA